MIWKHRHKSKTTPPAYTPIALNTALQDASPAAMDAAFEPTNSTWLDSSHLFFNNQSALSHLSACKAGKTVPNGAELAQYLASSIIPHTLSSAAYLSSCVAALLKGENENAIHYAYYSELRSAFAILARHGIGICDHAHFIVDSALNAQVINLNEGSHMACWSILEKWASNSNASQFISTVIASNSIPLDDYLKEAGFGGTASPVLADWIQSWGIDLKTFAGDKAARNNASYRPCFNPTQYTDTTYYEQLYTAIQSIWALLAPPAFLGIDQYLIFDAVTTFFKGQDSQLSDEGSIVKTKEVYDRLSIADAAKQVDLLAKSKLWPEVKSYLSADPNNMGGLPIPIQMCMRAAVLHRLAAGAALTLIRNSTHKAHVASNLENHFKQKLCLQYDDPSDLYADIEEAFATCVKDSQHPHSIFGHENAAYISNISLVPLWGLTV